MMKASLLWTSLKSFLFQISLMYEIVTLLIEWSNYSYVLIPAFIIIIVSLRALDVSITEMMLKV